MRAQADRVDNWRLLQDLAGVRNNSQNGKGTATKESTNGAGKATTTNGAAGAKATAKSADKSSKLPPEFGIGTKVKYSDGVVWISGRIGSIDPAVVLELDDDTEIRTTPDILAAGVAQGLIVAI